MANNNFASMNVSPVNTQFTPSLEPVLFNQKRCQLLDLQRQVKEAKKERLEAMTLFLFNNRRKMFSERDLARAFDLEMRDMVGARHHLICCACDGVFTELRPQEITPDFQQIFYRENHTVPNSQGIAWRYVTAQIFVRKIPVAWAPLDDNNNPILDRVSYRHETQYAWMFS